MTIDTVDLQHQLNALTQRYDALQQLATSIGSELALEPLLTRIVTAAAELLGAFDGTIGLVEQHDDQPVVRTAAVYNMPPEEVNAVMPLHVGLAGTVLHAQQPLCLDRYGDLEQPTLPELADHAVLGLPIWWGNEMIGFFGLGAQRPRRFNDADVALLTLFARHAAVAIINARHFAAERRRAARYAAITRIGRLITSSLSLHDIFRIACEAMCEHLGVAYVAAGIVDAHDPQMLLLLAQAGAHTHHIPADYRQSITIGIVGEAARTRQPVLINDVHSDERYLALLTSPQIRAELALPIIAHDCLLGVLNIEAEHTISHEDAAGIGLIADQLAIAMDNARRYAAERQRSERLQLIARINQRIAARLHPTELFATTVRELHERLGYDHVVLYLLDAATPTWLTQQAWASHWPHHAAAHQRHQLDHGTVGATARTRQAQMNNTNAVQHDELRAELALPILLGQHLFGVLYLAGRHPFAADDAQGVQIIVDQLAVALDNAQQQQVVYEQGQQVAVLEERHRLARDLHDSVTQLIFSTSLIAQSVASVWQRDPAEGERRTRRMVELSQHALAEMRALLTELHPLAPSAQSSAPVLAGTQRLRHAGLAVALQTYAATIARDDLRITVDAAGYTSQSASYEEAMYRIAQEALNNVVKHAHAHEVQVRLSSDEATMTLQVNDNGIGIAPPATAAGLGLRTMQHRAEALGGTLNIECSAAGGTRIEVHIPANHSSHCTAQCDSPRTGATP